MYAILAKLGFAANPFGSFVAEKEPNLEKYIVRPAYYQTISERTARTESFVLFGARGAGKSATRIALYKECWEKVQAGKQAPLAVTLDSFSGLLTGGMKGATLGAFVHELAFLAVEAVLVWLAALDDNDRAEFTGALDKSEEGLVISLVETFYLAQPEITRRVATTKALQLLDQAWHKRPRLWMQQKWDGLAALVANIASAIVKKKTGVDASIEDPLKLILAKAKPGEPIDETRFAFEIVNRLVELAGVFGFHGILVLIDKADETELTNDSTEATARLLYPLLANTRLLETPGISWMFCLWNRVREHYGPGTMPVRLDKIANAEIIWENRYLVDLINQRLLFFSDRQVQDLRSLFQPNEFSTTLIDRIVAISMNSPRELIRVLDTILREHDEQQGDATLLSAASVEQGLDKYAREFVENTFEAVVAQQFLRLGKTEFTNRDVQAAFRINHPSARNKIRNWEDAGLVAQIGTRPSGEIGGKPAHEFGISDERVRRVVANGLTSLATFDADEDEPAVAEEPVE